MPSTPEKAALWQQFLKSGGNKADTKAWQAYQKSGATGGSSTKPKAPTPDQYLGNLPNPGDWFSKALTGLDDFTNTNQDTNSARDWINDMLNSNMSRNPWEGDLYNDIGNVTPNDTLEWLRQYIGDPGGGSNRRPDGSYGTTTVRYKAAGAPSTFQMNAQNGGGGGNVPDTVGPSNGFFAQQIKALFDPARLDPANDPTMKATLDAMRRENSEDLLSSIQDLTARAEEGGAYGSGLYQAMMGKAREENMESLDSAIAGLLHGAREGALGRQMGGLDMTNTRDIAAMQDATNRYGIDASAAAAGAGASAAAADAAEGRRLQALNMLLGGQMDILGLRGQMANMRQGGQMGAMEGALNLGNMGMNALNSQGNIANSILGNLLGYNNQQLQYDLGRRGIGVDRGRLNLAERQWEDQVSQGSLNDLLNIMIGIGGMGGTNNQPGSYVPSGIDPMLAGLMAGFGTYFQGRNSPQAP